MSGKTLTLQVCDDLAPEAEAVRREAFLGRGAAASMRDAFDSNSTHLVMWVDAHPMGAIRITHPPSRVFRSWTRGAAELPDDPFTADIGRLCVTPSFAGLGLSKLLVPICLLKAGDLGYRLANGVASATRMLETCLGAYKASVSGPTVTSYEPNFPPLLVTPIIWDLVRHRAHLHARFEQQVVSLEHRGFSYIELENSFQGRGPGPRITA